MFNDVDTEDNVNKVNQKDTPLRKRDASITGELRGKFGGEECQIIC